MKRITVIGAGIGGLTVARELAKIGFQVEVFERSDRENIAYDWHDDVEPSVFKRVGLDIPKEHFEKNNWTFYGGNTTKPLNVSQPDGTRDYSIERRPLHSLLIDSALEQGANIYFSTVVDSLIIEGDEVKGVIVNGDKIYSDLVIDSSGCDSPFRDSLPDGVDRRIKNEDVFVAWRAFYNSTPDITPPIETNRAYLRFMGKKGISWCLYDPSGLINVLIGQTDALSEKEFNDFLNELKRLNPILGDQVVRGGRFCRIPIRHTLEIPIVSGYLAIGDCAFMTIPLLGSGIASSMLAGKLLAETLEKDPSLSVANLWNYQVKVFKEFGAKYVGIDIMKKWLLNANMDKISFIFQSNILSEEDLSSVARGESIKLSFASLFKKIINGRKNLPLLLELNSLINKMKKAEKIALTIPKAYNKEKILIWKARLDKFFIESK